MTLYAHSNNESGIGLQTYKDHIENVIKHCKDILDHSILPNMKCFNDKETKAFENAVLLAAEFHDLGKLDQSFQYAVETNDFVNNKPINHVEAGVQYMLSQYDATGNLTFILSAAIILGHHIGLQDMSISETKGISPVSLQDILKRHADNKTWKCLDGQSYTVETYTAKMLDSYIQAHEKEVSNTFASIEDAKKYGVLDHFLPLNKIVSNFTIVKMAISILVEADHKDTSRNYGQRYDDSFFDFDINSRQDKLKNYVMSLQSKGNDTTNERQIERNQDRQELFELCSKFNTDYDQMLLDGTVGMGKTLSGLAVALNYAHDIPKCTGIMSIAPYIALLDQMESSYRNSISIKDNDISVVHSLVNYSDKISDPYFKSLSRNLSNEITLITSIGATNALIKNNVSMIKLFHKFAGKVIFIDEYDQFVNHEHWKMIIKLLQDLSKYFNVKVVYSSGTPVEHWSIFNDSNEDLVGRISNAFQHKIYSKESKRVRYDLTYNSETLSQQHLAEIVLNTTCNVFVCLDTISKCIELYNNIKDSGKKVYVRHSRLTPVDRLRHFNKMKDDMKNNNVVFITTPGGDIGLDISFEVGFKEHTTANSMMQFCGRINRNNEFSNAVVYTFRVDGNSNTSLSKSKKIIEEHLATHGVVTPNQCTELYIATHEDKDSKKKRANKQESFYHAYTNCNFEELGSMFYIIGPSYSFLVNKNNIHEKIRRGYYIDANEMQRYIVSIQIYDRENFREKIQQFMAKGQIEPISSIDLNDTHFLKKFDNKMSLWTGEYDEDGQGIVLDGEQQALIV